MVITEERVLNIEELLSNIHSSRKTMLKNKSLKTTKVDVVVKKLKHMSKNLPVGMIILLALFAALGSMVITLKAEVADFGNLKEQVSANDLKFKITIIEDKFEASEKEKEALKRELAQIKNSLETLQKTKTERKALAQK